MNYRAQKFKDVLRGYDAAFDTVGGHNLTDSFDILKRGARLVSVASIDPTSAREDFGMGPVLTAVVWVANAKLRSQSHAGVSYRSLLMRPSGEDLGVLADLVDSGRLKAVTDRLVAGTSPGGIASSRSVVTKTEDVLLSRTKIHLSWRLVLAARGDARPPRFATPAKATLFKGQDTSMRSQDEHSPGHPAVIASLGDACF